MPCHALPTIKPMNSFGDVRPVGLQCRTQDQGFDLVGDAVEASTVHLNRLDQPDEEVAPKMVGEVALHAGGVRSGTVEFRDDLPPGCARHLLGKRCHLLGWRRVGLAVFRPCGRRRGGKPVRDVDAGEVGGDFLVAAGLLQAPRTMLCPGQFALEPLPSPVTDQVVLVDGVRQMQVGRVAGPEVSEAAASVVVVVVAPAGVDPLVSLPGRPRMPLIGGILSTRGRSWVTSWRLPPVSVTARGMRVGDDVVFEPGLRRSTRLGPVLGRL